MGKFIVKIKDKYLEWSEIVDAPVTFGMSLEDFKKYYMHMYGFDASNSLAKRLERVEQKGISAFDYSSVEELIAGNRAGENEKELTLDEIYEKYCEIGCEK